MNLKCRQFIREFKLQFKREVESCKFISRLACEHQVYPTSIHQWHQQFRRQGERAFPGNGRAVSDEARIAALERKVGQLTMENDLLKSLESAL